MKKLGLTKKPVFEIPLIYSENINKKVDYFRFNIMAQTLP
jgi:hypothetical protein